MRVAIIGSRGLNIDISKYIPAQTSAIISGGARGIDSLAEAYAQKRNIPKRIIRPEYNKYGKAAPIIRNRSIVDMADMIVAIWDGESQGTKHVIDYARARGKLIEIYIINENGFEEMDLPLK